MKVTAVYGWCRMEKSGFSYNAASIVGVHAPDLLAAIQDCGEKLVAFFSQSSNPYLQLHTVEGELVVKIHQFVDYWYDEKSYHQKKEIFIIPEDGEEVFLELDPETLDHLDLREIKM